MESMRQTWNDARMDEFANRTDQNFRELRTELRSELRTETGSIRSEMNDRFARLERRFDILFGALATGFVGAVVSHFLG
jgi:hypothetical protein